MGLVIAMKARIRGVQVHMQQFEFFFGLALGRNLQSLFAAEGQREADLPFFLKFILSNCFRRCDNKTNVNTPDTLLAYIIMYI